MRRAVHQEKIVAFLVFFATAYVLFAVRQSHSSAWAPSHVSLPSPQIPPIPKVQRPSSQTQEGIGKRESEVETQADKKREAEAAKQATTELEAPEQDSEAEKKADKKQEVQAAEQAATPDQPEVEINRAKSDKKWTLQPCIIDGARTCYGALSAPIPIVLGENRTLMCCPPTFNKSKSEQVCKQSSIEGTIITGTGRAGTSFLVALLTDLRLPTGFDSNDADGYLTQEYRAGLEHATLPSCFCHEDPGSLCIDWSAGVEIIKSPQLAFDAQHMLWLGPHHSNLADVIVPMRDSVASAASRARNGFGNGGFAGDASSEEEQIIFNERLIGKLLPALAQADVRTHVLAFPRLAQDEDYIADKLRFLLERYGVSRERFVEAHRARRNAKLIHQPG